MKIFISWSGKRSRAVAEALNEYLKRVIQAVKPFYSPEIEKGAKWGNEIDNALEGTKFGIICLTPDNLHSTWVHYEAGALSKTPDAKIWTFLHGLDYGDVPPPLSKFQHTVAEKDDVLKLLKSINARLSDVDLEPLGEQFLEENFNLFWGLLEQKLKEAEKLSDDVQWTINEVPIVLRDEREMISEALELIREQQRRLERIEARISINPLEKPVPFFYKTFDSPLSVKGIYISYKNEIGEDIKSSVRKLLKTALGECKITYVTLNNSPAIQVNGLQGRSFTEPFFKSLRDELITYGLEGVVISYI
jgi:hypothetical protein